MKNHTLFTKILTQCSVTKFFSLTVHSKWRDLQSRSWRDHHTGTAGWWWLGHRHWPADHTETSTQSMSECKINSATHTKNTYTHILVQLKQQEEQTLRWLTFKCKSTKILLCLLNSSHTKHTVSDLNNGCSHYNHWTIELQWTRSKYNLQSILT